VTQTTKGTEEARRWKSQKTEKTKEKKGEVRVTTTKGKEEARRWKRKRTEEYKGLQWS
jgi:hypothetical protein